MGDRDSVITNEVVDKVRTDIALVGFWSNTYQQDELRKWVKQHPDDTGLFDYASLTALSDQIVELAKANQTRLAETAP